MKNKFVPDWLQTLLDESGFEQGIYTFHTGGVKLAGLPKEFVGIAEGSGRDLVVERTGNNGVIYRFEKGEIDVFAMNKEEFMVEVRRDEAWECLEENMPAGQSFGVSLVLFTTSQTGERMVLGRRGGLRSSALVVSGRVLEGEMLIDAVKRELETALQIADFDIVDVLDEGDVLEDKSSLIPSFRIEVEVDTFPARERVSDPMVDWVNINQQQRAN